MHEIEKTAEILKLLGDKNRLTIMKLLQEREMCVCEFVEILQTSQPNISQHMRKLKSGGLVKETKRGQWVYYSLTIEDQPFISAILNELPSQKERLREANCDEDECC
ncbi:ArsR/SmtB family transcription factor [Marinicrinis lubricantis]|uniref:ArsR/SmtB family transcription factor n=1 Tax=Marinicrinis lubricantis TaxID=2086470 RepID=A0ABW1IRW2_9BACL